MAAAGDSPYIPLPSWLDRPREAARVFDSLALLYDRARPGYPSELVAELLLACRLDSSSRLLEVGCGTGQLTRDLALCGARLRCVEAGPALAALARERLAAQPNVEVVTGRFEDFEDEEESYDAVVSATAFHWVDPAVSFEKSARLLRPGGWLCLLTNSHVQGGSHTEPRFVEPVRRLHEQLAPELGGWSFPTAEEVAARAGRPGDIAAVWSRIDRKTGEPPEVSHLFEPPVVKTERWLARYSRQGYLAMLATQSSYALLEEDRRRELLEAIGRVIDVALGGVVTKSYLAVLALARRRGREDPPGRVDAVQGSAR